MGKHHNFKAKPFALVIKINSEKKSQNTSQIKVWPLVFWIKKKKKKGDANSN